jgi:predicted dehydrogenase
MQLTSQISRRSFLGQAPLVGAGVVAAGPVAQAQDHRQGKPGGVFRVGCLNVSSYSHLEPIWAPLMNPRPGTGEIPFSGMRITHCWEIDPERAKNFAKTFGCEAVPNFDDMLGKVDGIISGGYYNHPWNHVLHEPYLKAGLPNLINRPFSNSLAKARQMVETARKHGATILVPSAFEHNDAIASAKAWATGKKVVCYHATNSFDDYPTHGIHGVYLVCRAIAEAGNPVASVSFRTDKWHSPPGVMTFEHHDKDGRQFFGTLHQVNSGLGSIRIHAYEESFARDFDIRPGTGEPFNKTELWAPTIWAFQQMAINRTMPQSFEQILHKNNVFLAGWRSVLTQGGKPVRLEDVPDDWETPVELPNRPGDPTVSLFRKKFG